MNTCEKKITLERNPRLHPFSSIEDLCYLTLWCTPSSGSEITYTSLLLVVIEDWCEIHFCVKIMLWLTSLILKYNCWGPFCWSLSNYNGKVSRCWEDFIVNCNTQHVWKTVNHHLKSKKHNSTRKLKLKWLRQKGFESNCAKKRQQHFR